MAKQNIAPTSIEAYESIDVPRLEKIIYTAIRSAGKKGMTADELLLAFPHLTYGSVTARPAALKRKGLVVDSGFTRMGRTGRRQIVLVAKEFAGDTNG